MILEEFLIAIGVKADTQKLKETEDGLKKVETQANKTDSKIGKFSTNLSGFIKNFATFAVASATAIQTTLLGAWAYFDSTIDKIEELQNAEDESMRTTKEQVEMAKKYRENMGRMGNTIESVKTKIALGFLPAMYELSKTYAEFLDANKELISNGISKLLEWVTRASQVFTNFIKFIDLIVTKTVGWEKALYIIGGAFIWFKRAMLLAFATNPITWVVAAIAGLLLLIDDFMTYLKGGKSQFGDFWGAMLGWIKENQGAIDKLIAMAVWLKDAFVYAITYIGASLMDLVSVFANVWNLIASIFSGNTENIKKYWSQLIDSLVSLWSNIVALFNPTFEAIVTLFKKAFNGVLSWLSSWYSKLGAWALSLVNIFKGIAGSLMDSITKPFSDAFEWVSNKWSSLKGMFSSGVKANVNINDRVGSGVATTNRTSNVTYNNNVQASVNVNSANGISTANQVKNSINKSTVINVGGVQLA